MSKIESYKQCTMERNVPNGVVSTIAFVPSEFGVIGKVVKLKNEDGSWTDGWKIKTASEEVDAKLVESRERDYTKQRKASDI